MAPTSTTFKPLHQEPHPLACNDGLWTPTDAAQYLGVAVLTLADWRVKGFGPDFVKVGSFVRYRRSAIETWLQSHTRKGA